MKGKVCLKSLLVVFLFLNLFQLNLTAQTKNEKQVRPYNDSTYYVYFPRSITGRIFFSQKYLVFNSLMKNGRDLNYRPNTTSNLGIGATWNNLTANLAYGFGIGKHQNETKGKTKYLDIQLHYFQPKWATDAYAQLYKGYHLAEKGFAAPPGSEYYYRPDIKVDLFGISRYRIFNSARFSYRAAFIQNEWQKKSAGTLLVGAEAYYSLVRGDSNLFPKALGEPATIRDINKISSASIGPGIGYAYTLVLLQHLFVTASLTANLNFSYTTEYAGDQKGNRISVNPVSGLRLAAGYNRSRWSVSGTWINASVPFNGKAGDSYYVLNSGNYRFTVARRFLAGKKLRKNLHKMETEMKKVSI